MAPPKRIPGETQAAVKRLIEEGLRPAEIASRLGISRPTVTYHVKRLGLEVDLAAGHRYDWSAIRAYYDEGHSAAECRAHFGFNRGAWSLAVARGAIVPRPAAMPVEVLLTGPRNRVQIRNRLIAEGLKPDACEACGLREWRGEPIPLQLHHVNGVGEDNRLENLMVLCANCHALTDTWGGRNKHRATRVDGEPSGVAPAPAG